MKSAPPIALTLSPWTGRKDAKTLTADRERLRGRDPHRPRHHGRHATPHASTATPPEEAGHRDRSGTTDSA